MSEPVTVYRGADVFDGERTLHDHALVTEGSRVIGVVPVGATPAHAAAVELDGGTIAPGFVDLQVNGGGGVMFNNEPTAETLGVIASAQASVGATNFLPTLITDTAATVRSAIDAVAGAIELGTSGIVGLHLEGPHLAPARKGAHDRELIRPMGEEDLGLLLEAATRLPTLIVTIAPESVTTGQMRRLVDGGVILSLGHTDASFDQAAAAAEAGVRCATHLFNAMSQFGSREPGVAGAVLELGELSAGLIADLIHVHPATIATALRAKRGPGSVFLVSDAMATAGSDIKAFMLNDREILRDGVKLTLADGTLAGAHLELATAVRNMIDAVGLSHDQALAMATSVPARVIGRADEMGSLARGRTASFLHLDADMRLLRIWQRGQEISRPSN